MNRCEIGILTKPQGLKGEFRVKHNLQSLTIISNLKQIIIDDKIYNVLKTTDRGGFWIFKLKELDNINQVEVLRGKLIYADIDEDNAIKYNNNIGYSVVANNDIVGIVSTVDNFGSTDIYNLDNGKSFPIVPNLILNIDDNKKIVVVDLDILNEVIV